MSTTPASPTGYADPVLEVASRIPHAAEAGDLSPQAMREALAVLEQLVNMTQAVQADVMVAMAREAEQLDADERQLRGRSLMPGESRTEFVADEIAVTLSCTKVLAARRYALALATSEHPAIAHAWRRGQIDTRKAQVICDGLTDVSHPAADALAGQAAEYAASHTGPEVRRWLSRRVIAADPSMAEIRRSRAVADRKVMLTPLPDGVCELSALLPSAQARQVYDTVNSLAHNADPGDVRTMDQRRADALFDLLVGRAEPPQVTVQVVVPADSLLGESVEPGHLSGVGPITSTEALQLAGMNEVGSSCNHNVTFRRLLTDPDTGTLVDLAESQYRPSARLDRAVRARDGVCRFPGCSRAATTTRAGTDLDHTIPWPRGQTTASNLAVLCRHHHRLKHSLGWSAELLPDGVMEWTTPAGKTLRTTAWAYADPT